MAPPDREDSGESRLMQIARSDDLIWYRKRNLRFLYIILVPTAFGVEWTSGFDSSMMNSLQAVKSWVDYFGNPDAARLGLLNAMYSLGALMAIPFVPAISQYLGRRRTIWVASLVMSLGAGLQAGARNNDMFLASRWVLGFGIPFAIVNASALIGELSYPKERAVMTSLFNFSWFLGSVAAAGTTYGTFQMTSTWSWRLPSLLQLVPSLCQLTFMAWCPESPRWLVSRDRADEALAVLRTYHGEGPSGDEFARLEFAEIRAAIEQEAEQAASTSPWLDWAEAVRGAPMRRRFALAAIVGFFTQWSGNGLISFYMKKVLGLVGISDDRTVQKVILANTCWGLICCLPAALIAPRYPRRAMFLLCTIGTAVVYTVWTIASARFAIENSSKAAIPVLVFMFLYAPFYNLGWNALAYTYMVEIFPFRQRAKGIAVEQLAVRFAVFFNTYVNPIAMDAIGWKYYLVYCVWILVEVATVYFVFPETHNKTLEELSFLFEGQEVQDKVQQKVDKALQLEMREEDAAPAAPPTAEPKDGSGKA